MLLIVIIMSDHRLNLQELALAPVLEKEEGEQQSEETHDPAEEHETVLESDLIGLRFIGGLGDAGVDE